MAASSVNPQAVNLAALRRNNDVNIELEKKSKKGMKTIMSVNRHMLVSDLKKNYLALAPGRLNTTHALELTEVHMSKDEVELKNEFTLMKYNIRDGCVLSVWIVPLFHLTITPKIGHQRRVVMDVTDDWTARQIKEEFTRRRYAVHPHDWTASDVTMMFRHEVMEDSRTLSSYRHGKHVGLVALFNWKGHSYRMENRHETANQVVEPVGDWGEGDNEDLSAYLQNHLPVKIKDDDDVSTEEDEDEGAEEFERDIANL